jgi:hypothetical protein
MKDGFMQEGILNFAIKFEKSLDIETARKLNGARSALLATMRHHLEERKANIKKETLSALFKPFSPGLWYCTYPTHMDCVYPNRWHRTVFEIGDHILVLRCAGWNNPFGSWWWIVDKNGMKLKVLWRYEARAFAWEKECPLPPSE